MQTRWVDELTWNWDTSLTCRMCRYRFKDAFLVALDDNLTMVRLSVATPAVAMLILCITKDSYPRLRSRLVANATC